MSSEYLDNATQKLKDSFQKTLDWFLREISSLRGSRITIDLIEDIKVEYYGSKIFLKEIASLSLIDPRTISVESWDKSSVPNIEKSLYESGLGGSIKNEGNRVLFSFPALIAEDKEKLRKLLKQKMEKAKVSLRQARDEAWREIQEAERTSKISEDEKFNKKEELQKLIDEFEEKIEEMEERKEKEILH